MHVLIIVHARTIVHACTMMMLHGYTDHSLSMYDHLSACMCYDYSTCIYWDHSICLYFDDSVFMYYHHSTCVHVSYPSPKCSAKLRVDGLGGGAPQLGKGVGMSLQQPFASGLVDAYT